MSPIIRAGKIAILLLAMMPGVGANPLNPQDFVEKINSSDSYVIFDIRDAASFNKGHLHSALNVTWNNNALDSNYKQYVQSTSTTVIVVCQDGTQSKPAADFLKAAGYLQSYYITGGMDACNNIMGIVQDNTSTWGVIKALFGGKPIPRLKV